MLQSAVETRPGYKELLRELIRSQIGHLLEQLSGIGEESFVVSAARDDEVPHLIGSARGLGYMKGFTGVQEGFLHYLQKNACTSESHQASKPAEKRQTLITHTDSNLTSVSEPLRSNPDEVTTSKPDLSVQIETSMDQSHGVIESGEQSEGSVQVGSLKKESDGVTENEPLRSNPDVTPAYKPDYSVQIQTLKDQSLGVIESGNQSEGSIINVVEQLSETGEESFVVSAAGDDEVPHLIGSARGLGYMKGLTGVQEGFLHYLQKSASTSASIQTSKQAEKRQTLITHTDSKLTSTVLTCLSESLRCNPDVTPASKADYSVQVETFKDQSLGVIESGKHSDGSVQVESLKKESDRVTENEQLRSNPYVTQASEPDYSVPIATFMDQSLGVINSRKQSEGSVHSVVEEQPMVNEARPNTQAMPEESFMHEDKTFEPEKYAESVKTCKETCDETRINEVLYATSLSAEAMDSDDEESDSDIDENGFDEMEEEEIFPQLINDLNKLKESFPEKMDTSDENNADVNNVQRNANANTAYVITNCPEGLKMKIREKTDAADLPSKIIESGTDIPPDNENDSDEVKVVVCGRTKPKQVYKFRSKLFSLTDTIVKKDLLCRFCKKDCRTMKEVREHEGTHSKQFLCYKCEKDLESLTKLREHNTQCIEVPMFVQQYFVSNPDCCPKRHWKGRKNMKEKRNKLSESVDNEPGVHLQNSWSYKELLEWRIVNNTCPFPNCGRTYLFFHQVKEHLVVHTNERPFKCGKCRKTFRWRRDLTQHEKILHGIKHIRKTHGHSKAFKATSTSTADPVKNSQKDRLVRDTPQNTLKTTTQQNSGILKSNFKTRCKTVKRKTLNTFSDARIRKYKCPYCEKRYFTNGHLEEHVPKHTGVKNFKCSVCDQKFLLKSQFPGHKKKCDLENPGRVGAELIRLNRKNRPRKTQNKQIIVVKKTLRSMVEVEKALETARQRKITENSSKVRCNVCGLELKTMKSLRNHILSKHFMELYLCSCGERFHTAANQYLHMKRTGCKSFKTAVTDTNGTQGGNTENSISNDESHKERFSDNSGTETD